MPRSMVMHSIPARDYQSKFGRTKSGMAILRPMDRVRLPSIQTPISTSKKANPPYTRAPLTGSRTAKMLSFSRCTPVRPVSSRSVLKPGTFSTKTTRGRKWPIVQQTESVRPKHAAKSGHADGGGRSARLASELQGLQGGQKTPISYEQPVMRQPVALNDFAVRWHRQ